MDAISLLTQRSSMPRLIAPAPDDAAMTLIKRAALRVPDHMNLMPVRCDLVLGDDLSRLGKLFAQAAAHEEGFNERDRQRAAQLPLRAPLIIVVSTVYEAHPSVPALEQYATAACATMAMQQACFTLNYGAIWRSGAYAQSAMIKQGLGISQDNEIVGFLYIGTPAVPTPIKPERSKDIFQPVNIHINEEK
ncbi:MAG: nitroreductase family protein [Idiomarina sp.]|nr:nitroreductase family protein [Idiomarina sp.]